MWARRVAELGGRWASSVTTRRGRFAARAGRTGGPLRRAPFGGLTADDAATARVRGPCSRGSGRAGPRRRPTGSTTHTVLYRVQRARPDPGARSGGRPAARCQLALVARSGLAATHEPARTFERAAVAGRAMPLRGGRTAPPAAVPTPTRPGHGRTRVGTQCARPRSVSVGSPAAWLTTSSRSPATASGPRSWPRPTSVLDAVGDFDLRGAAVRRRVDRRPRRAR